MASRFDALECDWTNTMVIVAVQDRYTRASRRFDEKKPAENHFPAGFGAFEARRALADEGFRAAAYFSRGVMVCTSMVRLPDLRSLAV